MGSQRIKLEDLDRRSPFNVPEGYFEELPSIIQARIPAGKPGLADRPEEVRSPWYAWSWRRTVALASAMAVAVLIWATLPVRQGPLEPDSLVAVSDEAIMDYLRNQDMDFYDLSYQDVVQKAFSDESTLLNYLEDLNDDVIRQQLLENTTFDENI